MTPKMNACLAFAIIAAFFMSPAAARAAGRVEVFEIDSRQFNNTSLKTDPRRKVQVYLPEGYEEGERRYPVLYALHDFFEHEDALFDRHGFDGLLDAAIASGRIKPVIVVVADFSTQPAGSLYTNSPVTGNWRNFLVEELVLHIDQTYRTQKDRASRGLFGYHIGGYGAIRIASRHPDVFGSVYALHPVGTGLGHATNTLPDWEKLASARSLDDLNGYWIAGVFTSIFQAHLPNPDRPPLFFDPPKAMVDGVLIVDTELTARLTERFYLEAEIPAYADNLKKLIAFKFDWGRHDPNQDHVVSNQYYTRKLREFGVPHEAEEYQGGWGDRTFVVGGRADTDLIPFFAQHLSFE